MKKGAAVDECPHCHRPTHDREIIRLLNRIDRKVNHLMTDQDRLDADVAALGTGLAVVAQEIADLKAANPALDFTGLDKAVSDLAALAPAAPPAP
jgi:hypothetical protein